MSNETKAAAEADETMTKSWMEQLGVEDGGTLAASVVDQLRDADTPERVNDVSTKTIAAINQLTAGFRERGVSEQLIYAWRAACHDEMTRIFGEYHDANRAAGEPHQAAA